jgi:hypothetical protein
MNSRSVSHRLDGAITWRLDGRIKQLADSRPIYALTWELGVASHRDLEWLRDITKEQVAVEVADGTKR